MCIGVPMRLLRMDGNWAWCEAGEAECRIEMLLVGDQPPGTWLLTFQGAARQVLTETEALQTLAALEALSAAMRGDGDVDRYFADLVDREPQLPEHLRTPNP